jgi:hypothetical protein
MDKTPLVGPDLVAGRRIIEGLERRGIPVDAAAWLQDDDSGIWRFVISSSRAENDDPRHLYREIRAILRTLPSSGLELDDILVTGPTDNLVKDLARLIRTGSELVMLRLHDLELGGRLYRSSRIYRVQGGHGPQGWIEDDARVRVKATGRLGVIRGVVTMSSEPRYLVVFDLPAPDLDSARDELAAERGGDFTEQELDFLYSIRPSGSPEKPPLIARPA